MIKRTHLLRIASLAISFLATPATVLAEDIFAKAIEFVTKRNEIKEGLRSMLTEEDVECALAHARAVSEAAEELYAKAKNTSWCDIETLQAILEEVKTYNETIIPQLDDCTKVLWKADLEGKSTATWNFVVTSESIKDAFDYAQSKANRYNYFANLSIFAKELISSKTYIDAWQELCAAKGFSNKMNVLNMHPAALTGVVIATTAAIITCTVYGNKIKAAWNRLFGSSAKTDEELGE